MSIRAAGTLSAPVRTAVGLVGMTTFWTPEDEMEARWAQLARDAGLPREALADPETLGSLAGWSFHETLALLGIFMTLEAFIEIVLHPNLDELPEHIRTGQLDSDLLKPVSTQFLVSTPATGRERFGRRAPTVSRCGLPGACSRRRRIPDRARPACIRGRAETAPARPRCIGRRPRPESHHPARVGHGACSSALRGAAGDDPAVH